jgi:Flp pilus assembly pilin Flp
MTEHNEILAVVALLLVGAVSTLVFLLVGAVSTLVFMIAYEIMYAAF